ncbi:MAG: hypothetical protein DRQ89_12410 [Epsilonproteobacteria bacterium]|nr:MAG: hypothetical protein DRQ89_12410 [Campylobacterota bacterium]
MRYKYPETQKALDATKEDLLNKRVKRLEGQLEAAYWASGKWVTDSYDKWLETINENYPLEQA